ncbi:tannase and feruloyl esterase [Penicillium manginii]|uniref:tannase and feruloyl esterase n=1 Tax=Penicillium manginii TaxID=203109 RepID=UPI00254925BD|nr:tannase and feruloyl esterase [Penicillium manginii]KAJ5749798.1 tannase and feruloyl esterase [Penicillium manginii]
MGLGNITSALLSLNLFVGTRASTSLFCTKDTFSSLTLDGIHVASLNVTAASGLPISGYLSTDDSTGSRRQMPPTVDICLVTLTYTHPGTGDNVNTYIGLPLDAENWNSRFLMDGGGGWVAGGQEKVLTPVGLGYVSSSTDGGHNASTTTAQWGLKAPGKTNWPALEDFASRALHEAALLGKMAIKLYYKSEPRYSYWNGCSTGGRQGHMMAQNYPELFDGIVGAAPAINWDKFITAEFWGAFMANILDVQPPSCVFSAFRDAAIQACDLLDGVKDNIIALPGQCHFRASSIIGQTVDCIEPNGKVIITKNMADLVQAIWDGPRSTEGKFEWFGFHQDTNLSSILSSSCTSVDDCTLVPFSIADDWVKVFLKRNADFDTDTLTLQDYTSLFHQSIDQYASIIGTENPDLTKLKRAGTKMITWHGMQDQLIMPNGTVDYYNRVMSGDPNVADYYRFFLAPGVEHCHSGTGFDPSATTFDVLRGWVENGTVPETLMATAAAVGSSNTSFTRTGNLCLYPKVFTYTGNDPNEASSFSCV